MKAVIDYHFLESRILRPLASLVKCMLYILYCIVLTWGGQLLVAPQALRPLLGPLCTPVQLMIIKSISLSKSQNTPDLGPLNYYSLYPCKAKGYRSMPNQVGPRYSAILWATGNLMCHAPFIIHGWEHQSPHLLSQLDPTYFL
jgi:hypothetical protein